MLNLQGQCYSSYYDVTKYVVLLSYVTVDGFSMSGRPIVTISVNLLTQGHTWTVAHSVSYSICSEVSPVSYKNVIGLI